MAINEYPCSNYETLIEKMDNTFNIFTLYILLGKRLESHYL